ncbi:pirin family protein [Corynebacterium silvaticum]|uniref:Pirin family protein n=1 Tax=Corynebacterium silvaticum TaxID=2320431 RepID=A0A7U5HMP9_9CORY|nr:pirin family protein [Corynebacterium silvaticum]ARU46606.1 pirin family protein [Corynebacterium silvaticum]UWH03917.1 pirin family protein [Corynebacterium silvaticum]
MKDMHSNQAMRAPVEIITAREVPLGGLRAMSVRRTLPQKKRTMIRAWCFVDHYGPDDVSQTGGMDVAPHPHSGLQTVSWLFRGEIEHLDSGGNVGTVRPGEVNLMTSGAGICHSEVSTATTETLHGVQLWVALPDSARNTAPRSFEHYSPEPIDLGEGQAIVFLGELCGVKSPVQTFTPLVGAEIRIEKKSSLTISLDPAFEHGMLIDAGTIAVEDVSIPHAALAYVGVGTDRIEITNHGDSEGRVLLIGGQPFEEDIVMWWNFVGRSTEDIRHSRQEWEARTDRFGKVAGYRGHGGVNDAGEGINAQGLARIEAPALPNVTLRPRRNPAPYARP